MNALTADEVRTLLATCSGCASTTTVGEAMKREFNTGACAHCDGRLVAQEVLPGTLRCAGCLLFKLPEDFPANHFESERNGRHSICTGCEGAKRRGPSAKVEQQAHEDDLDAQEAAREEQHTALEAAQAREEEMRRQVAAAKLEERLRDDERRQQRAAAREQQAAADQAATEPSPLLAMPVPEVTTSESAGAAERSSPALILHIDLHLHLPEGVEVRTA